MVTIGRAASIPSPHHLGRTSDTSGTPAAPRRVPTSYIPKLFGVPVSALSILWTMMPITFDHRELPETLMYSACAIPRPELQGQYPHQAVVRTPTSLIRIEVT